VWFPPSRVPSMPLPAKAVALLHTALVDLATETDVKLEGLRRLAAEVAAGKHYVPRKHLFMLQRFATRDAAKRKRLLLKIMRQKGSCLQEAYDMESQVTAAKRRTERTHHQNLQANANLRGSAMLANECWAGKGSNSKPMNK